MKHMLKDVNLGLVCLSRQREVHIKFSASTLKASLVYFCNYLFNFTSLKGSKVAAKLQRI